MKFSALAQRIFYPRIDSFDAAGRAMQNGGVAGWIMVAVHFILGAFVIMLIIPEQDVISGNALWPAMIQLFIAFFYGACATYSWRESRGAIVTMLVMLILDTVVVIARVEGFDPQAAIHILAIILAIGGLRGSFALAAFKRQGDT